MSLLKTDFDELRERIQHGRELGNTSFEPVYYLVFAPAHILEVKRLIPAWVARLKQDGWDVTVFSLAEAIDSLLNDDPRRKLWVAVDRRSPLDWSKTNQALSNALVTNQALQQRLETVLAEQAEKEHGLLLVTDLEALHPYLRIGAIESQLQGKFQVPTVFLYPGTRSGKSQLKFLGFYPEDGNYRSVHIGGN
ncbi:MAG: DUF1788 domain-containing protein [Blastocatellia bacterium]|nr:DUF1788 domain-containing protein [Blastocatellia bacterium]